MLDLFKSCIFRQKGLYALLLFILILPIAFATLDECSGSELNQDDIPCYILLPYDGDCANHNVSVYNESELIYTQTLSNYSVNQCNATFNQTSLGTYALLWSTEDTGSIIVRGGLKMIYLLYFCIIVIAIFLAVGFAKQDITFLTLGGFIMMVLGVWLMINGFQTLSNMISDTIGMVALGTGAYITFKANYEYWKD